MFLPPSFPKVRMNVSHIMRNGQVHSPVCEFDTHFAYSTTTDTLHLDAQISRVNLSQFQTFLSLGFQKCQNAFKTNKNLRFSFASNPAFETFRISHKRPAASELKNEMNKRKRGTKLSVLFYCYHQCSCCMPLPLSMCCIVPNAL